MLRVFLPLIIVPSKRQNCEIESDMALFMGEKEQYKTGFSVSVIDFILLGGAYVQFSLEKQKTEASHYVNNFFRSIPNGPWTAKIIAMALIG